MKTALIVYVVVSMIVWLYMVGLLWLSDKKMDAKGIDNDKFGYNFRKSGRRDGKFAITETAFWFTTPFLPVINIATLLFLIYLKTNNLRSRR